MVSDNLKNGKSIGWLHLSDFHCGADEQDYLWAEKRGDFLNDLKKMHKISGPWDIIFFTGDLTFSGTKAEFDQFDKELKQIREFLHKLGSNPVIFPVPGNHDLIRPPKTTPTLKALKSWHSDPEISKALFTKNTNPYKKEIEKAFKNYSDWWENERKKNRVNFHLGVLPGEYAASITVHGIKIGVIAQNTSYLQLESGDYQKKLALDYRQFLNSMDDYQKFKEPTDVMFLLTHHPPNWLSKNDELRYQSTIHPPGRFVLHLFGHLHEPDAREFKSGGSEPRRFLQGASLFGLKEIENSNQPRLHGYSAGRLIANQDKGIRIWPRIMIKTYNGEEIIVADQQFYLNEEDDPFGKSFTFKYYLNKQEKINSHLSQRDNNNPRISNEPPLPKDLILKPTPRFARRRCRVLPEDNKDLAMLYKLVIPKGPDLIATDMANSIIRDAKDSFTKTIALALLHEGHGNLEGVFNTLEKVRFSGIQECYRRFYRALALDKLDRCEEALLDLKFVLLTSPCKSDLIPAAQLNYAVCNEKLGRFDDISIEFFLENQDLALAGGEKLWHKALSLELIKCARTKSQFRYEDLVERSLVEELSGSPKGFVKTLLNWHMYTGAPISDINVKRLLDIEIHLPPTTRAGVLGQLKSTSKNSEYFPVINERYKRLALEQRTSYAVSKWLNKKFESHNHKSLIEKEDRTYSIGDILRRLEPDRKKIYLKTYKNDGIEVGFGRSGSYSGHAHLHFLDFIFSPDGFCFRDNDSKKKKSNVVLVVPPRSWLNDINLGDFFFMKFACNSGLIKIPDKTNRKLHESELQMASPPRIFVFDWFPTPSERRVIKVELKDSQIVINLQNRPLIKVTS